MLDIVTSMVVVWAVAAVLFLIAEGLTLGLYFIWFAFGAFAAMISAWLGAPPWMQVGWFFLLSILVLFIARPLIKRNINDKSQPTNADRVIGMPCIVTEEINNITATGAVTVGGKTWTARSADGSVIEAGKTVIAREIEGVKLIVDNV